MINGTYTVTVKTETEEASGDAEVTSQHVASIEILNETALTIAYKNIDDDTSDKEEATGILVYYDVKDQYGESMRNSTTIQWSASCHVANIDKTRGVLTLDRTDNKAFTYGESVYITGVHQATGTTKSATLTVGTKQAVDSVKVHGFVKKGTSTILTSLPAGFKSRVYYLVYSVYDKNGNEMVADTYLGSVSGEPSKDSEVTFTSKNILVIKEILKSGKDENGTEKNLQTVLTIDGVEYCAAFVEPGIDVNKGGTVEIDALANKTGNKSPYTAVVGDNQILKSFTLLEPVGIIADGEGADIPFTALDQNGDKITDFVTLASQSDFNKLQLNASYGHIALEEQNDGTAKLHWYDGTDGDWNSNSEDGIDRPISLTAVVVGGETDNRMIYVKDKAYPATIKDVAMDSVYVQRSGQELSLANFTFLDQYNRVITSTSYTDGTAGHDIYDNGFFRQANGPGLSGTDFSGYKFGVKVEFKGNPDNLESDTSYISATTGYSKITDGAIKHISVFDASGKYVTGAAFQVTSKAAFSVCADQSIRFTIEKYKDDYDDVSPIKTKAFQGVNINRVKGFEIGDLNTFYVNTDLSTQANGAIGGLNAQNITTSAILGINGIGGASNDDGTGSADPTLSATGNEYLQQIKVTGKYNGATVKIPKVYFTVGGNILGTNLDTAGEVVSTGATGYDVIDSVAVSDTALRAMDLYDANSAQYTRKLAEDTLKVTVYEASGAGIEVDETKIVNTATKKVYISDAAPYAAEICAEDAYTVIPQLTQITNIVSPSGLLQHNSAAVWGYNSKYGTTSYWKVLDQYGVKINASYACKVSNVEENAERYAENNFAVDKNDTDKAAIRGAELGDKFLLTITAKAGGATVTKDINITVGSDYYSCIYDSTNYYMDTLVDMDNNNSSSYPGLEKQRKDALGSN